MERNPPRCVHDPRYSDSESGCDGGNRADDDGICEFKILDVWSLGDGREVTEPESESSIVVVKVEPVPINISPSQESSIVKVQPILTNGSPSQGEIGAIERRVRHDDALPTSNNIHVKEELSEDSCNADGWTRVESGTCALPRTSITS
uniref:uncharacterized protein isoform X2 n=1 Tax=Myxine glutinosa TaxID=7769 RepID=UPI00358DF102